MEFKLYRVTRESRVGRCKVICHDDMKHADEWSKSSHVACSIQGRIQDMEGGSSEPQRVWGVSGVQEQNMLGVGQKLIIFRKLCYNSEL